MSKPEASPIRELDVRPMLRAGAEPFQAIMEAVSALAPGESLRLIAPFRPVPLFSVMANRGFSAGRRAFVWDLRGDHVDYEFDVSQGPRTPETTYTKLSYPIEA